MRWQQLSAIEKSRIKKMLLIAAIAAVVVSSIVLIIYRNLIRSVIFLFGTFFLIIIYYILSKILKKHARVKKLEEVFPDFLQLMSSNLRAGMTIDRAMLLSSRPEFAPLDAEILKTGKDIATGNSVEDSLKYMSKRINSEKITKTIQLLISGIRAGGNLAILLDQTAVNMRERNFVEKKAASSVMMYTIFIFLAVSIFAPALFSLSTVLVEVLTTILADIDVPVDASANMPFTLSEISISVTFIKYFSIVFMIVIDIFSSLVLGLVNKGNEKEGFKYLPAILILSLSVFFSSRFIISNIMKDML